MYISNLNLGVKCESANEAELFVKAICDNLYYFEREKASSQFHVKLDTIGDDVFEMINDLNVVDELIDTLCNFSYKIKPKYNNKSILLSKLL